MKKSLLLKSTLALALATPLLASAESQLSTGTTPAVARLDFRVVIPRVLFLAVGAGASGTALTNNPAVDLVDLSPLAANVGNGVAVTSAPVAVRVFGNAGQITITTTNPVNLTNGTGDTIPFTALTASSSGALAAPAFSGGTSTPTATGGLTNATSNWTFSYANTTVPATGTYTGTVTYTATMP